MAALREIIARFGVAFDDKALKQGGKAIDGVVAKLSSLGGLLVGGAIVSGLWSMIHGTAEQADALAKQASALGVSTDALQEWQHAANLSGVGAEEFSGALTKFNKNVADAAAGTGPAADALRMLGVAAKDSSGKLAQPIDLLDGVADGLARIENPAQRTQTVMALFGKSGAKLLPLFKEGSKGIAKLRAEVQELGGGFSPDFAARSEAMNDAITRLNLAWLSFKVRFGGLVIPLIGRFVGIATKATAGVSKWIDKIGLLKSGANLAAAAAAVLGTAFLVAGIKAIAPWLPIIATFAALILIVDELITLWQGGDTLIGRAIDRVFGAGTQKQVTQWLRDVVKSVSTMFTDTERAFTDFDAGLRLMWFDLTTWMGDAWDDLGTGVTLMFVKIGQDIEYVLAGIKDAFSSAINAINDTIDKIPGAKAVLGAATKLETNRRQKVVDDFNVANQYALDQSDARRAANARERQTIIDSSVVQRATLPPAAAGNVTTIGDTNVNITVPPGTPPQQVRALGEAARKGVQPSNKAKMAALVKTAG